MLSRFARGAAKFAASLCSPLFIFVAAVGIAITDLCFALFGKRSPSAADTPRNLAASVVIPNWNGRDLLEKFLPSVLAATSGHSDNEVIVVDNASSDGSVELLRDRFPRVRVLRQERNLGFGGGSNAGFRAARNDVVVLLNNDMRVEPDFLPYLLDPFQDPLVFSVSCQIFFSDPTKLREETGLTEIWWKSGRLRLSHRIDPKVNVTFPCAYGGGGSSAFDRKKFLELGGFDELLKPFYYEDTDLGLMAWKRGWKVLYEPRSIVFHEHRGTIGKKFGPEFIHTVVKKNALLYCWKNIHDWRMLLSHLAASFAAALFAIVAAKPDARCASLGLVKACWQVPDVMRARWRARELAAVSDREAFSRPRGGYFRDRFIAPSSPVPERLKIMFLSPYPIEPPVHGGAVFMLQTLRSLAKLADVHLVSFLDNAGQLPAQAPLNDICSSAEFFLRRHRRMTHLATTTPRVIREFSDRDFAWILHRAIYLKQIDVVQIEYTVLGQYACNYSHIPQFLFEHDISFQSLERRLGSGGWSLRAAIAYTQLLQYELRLLRRFDRIQVCSAENADYLRGFAPELFNRIDPDMRAVIDTNAYRFVTERREPGSILFLGSFNHLPNIQGLSWFLDEAWPRLLQLHGSVRLIIAGSGSSKALQAKLNHPSITMLGFVEDTHDLLQRCAVLICPVLSGSGIRVKLLEAFASGLSVVSTRLGAEGLADDKNLVCELADAPQEFAAAVVRLVTDESYAREMAARARAMVEREHDAAVSTQKLCETYRTEVQRRRPHHY